MPVLAALERLARDGRPVLLLTLGTVFLAAPGWFLAGCLVVWLAFSVAAALFQLGLVRVRLVSVLMLWSDSRRRSASLLALAAYHQFSPLKGRCLAHCRAPMEFLARHWQDGATGASGTAHSAWGAAGR